MTSMLSMQPVQASKNDPSQGPLAFMRAGEMNFVFGCGVLIRDIKSEAEGALDDDFGVSIA